MHLFFMMLPPSTLLIKVQMAVTLYFLQQSGITLWNQQLVVLEAFHAARTSPYLHTNYLVIVKPGCFHCSTHITTCAHVPAHHRLCKPIWQPKHMLNYPTQPMHTMEGLACANATLNLATQPHYLSSPICSPTLLLQSIPQPKLISHIFKYANIVAQP